MVARVRRAFQVSQGSVETLFRWGGKRLQNVAANLFRKLHTRFHQNSQTFRRWYKNILVFLSGHTVEFSFITSAKVVMPSICLFVCLSFVCLLATSHNNYWWDSRENFTREEERTLNFWNHPHFDLNRGSFSDRVTISTTTSMSVSVCIF